VCRINLTSLYIHDALLQVLKTLDFLARISFIIIEVQCNLMLSRADGKSENLGERSVFLFIYLAFPCTTHFLYRILDSKKTSRFQFSVPGLREIHRNLKQQKIFNSRDCFFRKSPFCTFSCINPGFGGPWGKL
jgi:hypothetical protein